MLIELAFVACIGFTGQKCTASYPATECGVRQAMRDMPSEGGVRVLFSTKTVMIHGDGCDTDDFRYAITTMPELWLPHHRHYIVRKDFHIEISPVVFPVFMGRMMRGRGSLSGRGRND